METEKAKSKAPKLSLRVEQSMPSQRKAPVSSEQPKNKIAMRGRMLAVILSLILALSLALTGCGGAKSNAGSTAGSTSGGNGAGGSGSGASGTGSAVVEQTIKYAAAYIADQQDEPSIGGMGDGWTTFALKLSSTDAVDDDYYEGYYDTVRGNVKAGKGRLSEDEYTPYARVSMTLKLIGKDPRDVEGYDLMKPLDNYKGVKDQGINAVAFALISANYTGYKLKNEKKYLNYLLKAQGKDGGVTYDGTMPDVDISAMTLQALAYYNGKNKKAAKACEGIKKWLSGQQKSDGSYGNCEATAQVIIALGCLKEDPFEDEGFVKDGKTLRDGLMKFAKDGAKKGFCHKAGGESNLMASQQALTALEAAKAGSEGESIYES